MLEGSVRCVCARFHSPAAVDRFSPSSCRLSSRSIIADGRATVFSYFKTNHTNEPTPQPETLVIRYGIVNGSFIVRERENTPLFPKATRVAIVFQTTHCVRLRGASSSDSFEIIAPEVRHRDGTSCALGNRVRRNS
jgi:hypothetical protein